MERPEFWGLYPWVSTVFYLFAAASLSVFFLGFISRLKGWQQGATEGRVDGGPGAGGSIPGLAWLSFWSLFGSGCLLAGRSMRISRVRAAFLIAVQWSFLLLFAGTVIGFVNFHVLRGFLTGTAYLAFKSVLNLAGVLFIICVAAAVARRALSKSLPSTGYDYFLLFLMLSTAVSAFALQGARFCMGDWADAAYSPAGLFFMRAFSGLTADAFGPLHNALWGLHALLALAFIAYMPYSRMFHVFAAQITTRAAAARERDAGIT